MIYDGLFLEARRPIDRPADDGFDVSCVPDDSAEHRVPLAQPWAVQLEQAFPLAGSRPGRDSATSAGCAGQPQPMACSLLKRIIHEHHVVGLRPQARKNR